MSFQSDNDQNSIVDEINKLLKRDKAAAIKEISSAVHKKIATSSRTKCLTLVSVTDQGEVVRVLDPAPPTGDYLSALIAFCRKKNWSGRSLDSGLSAPVADTVAEVFSKRIEKKSDKIVEKIIPYLLNNNRFLNGLSDALWDSYRGAIPKHLQSKVTDALTVKLKAALSSQIDTQAATAIKAAAIQATGSISTPLAAKISAVVIKTLSTKLGPIIVKVLSSAAFKAAVLAKIKALVGAAMIGALIKIVGTKLAAMGVGPFPVMWILLPLFAAWLAREAYILPEKLADKVSESIRTDLEQDFPDLTRTVAERITQYTMTKALGDITDQLINEDSVVKLMEEVVETAK